MDQHYDYIIAGAGAAGLSLAQHLTHAGLTDKRILLLDRAARSANDRTWCFWEKTPGPFERLVHRRWRKVSVQDSNLKLELDLAPYEYKMIRGGDFFEHMNRWLTTQPNIERGYGEVNGFSSETNTASVCVNGKQISAGYVFNSILPDDSWLAHWMRGGPEPRNTRNHFLLQHFLGWVIETPQPNFADGIARLMDFRLEQHDETRFVYVLPLDAHTALVEFTVFGPRLLKRDTYEAELRGYIAAHITQAAYSISNTEFGVIPMTDAPLPAPHGDRIINFSTAGGASKPSTGYTFMRIQRQCANIAQALAHDKTPVLKTSAAFGMMDRTLLEVLAHHLPGRSVFMRLFAHNPAARVLAFLDEDSTLVQTLALMSTVQIPQFTRALLKSI